MNRFLLHGVAAFLFLALLFVSGLLWMEMNQRFPRLPSGYYLGELKGSTSLSDSSSVRFSVWSEQGRYFTTLLMPGTKAVDIDPLARENGELFPLRVPHETDTLYLVGRELDEGKYRGTFSELQSQNSGRWSLQRVSLKPQQLEPAAQEETLLWLHLRKEFEQVAAAQERVAQLKKARTQKLNSLNDLLSDLEELKVQGKENLALIKEQFKTAQQQVASEEQKVRALFEQYMLARKVSKMGELLQLARDIRNKEYDLLMQRMNES